MLEAKHPAVMGGRPDAGAQSVIGPPLTQAWIPAFAGMTWGEMGMKWGETGTT